MYKVDNYKKIIRERLTSNRYKHSLGVAETAKILAHKNKIDTKIAYLTGLLHDYAKNMSDQELLFVAEKENLITDSIEYQQPQLLHGPVGAHLLKQDLGINNPEILNAVRYHTTGCMPMDKLLQIIYIADYIEPNRSFPGIEKIRELAMSNLPLGVLAGLNNSIKYVIVENGLLHILSVKARNWMLLNN